MEAELKRDFRDAKVVVEESLHAAFSVATGVFVVLPSLLLLESMVFQYLLAVGVGGIVARLLFLWMAPFLAKHSVTVAFIVNAVLIFCQAAFEFILAIIIVISDAFDLLSDALSAFGVSLGHAPDLSKDIDFSNLYTVSKSAVHDELTYIVDTCGPYDEAWAVIYSATKQLTHARACATVRFFWPLPWLSDFFDFWLRPFYDGSANPLDTHDAPANCNTVGDDYSVSLLCSGIGFGYVVVEVLIPLLLAIIVLISLASGLKRVAILAYTVVKVGVADAWRATYKVIGPLLQRLIVD